MFASVAADQLDSRNQERKKCSECEKLKSEIHNGISFLNPSIGAVTVCV